MTPVLAQARMELVLTLRRGESLVVTFLIPVLFLVFFSRIRVADLSMDFLAPGILALSIIATSMVSFAISTGFDRSYGVLKLIGGSPLTRRKLILSKVLAIVTIQLVQVVVIAAIALWLGWAPRGGAVQGTVVLLVGSAAFAGLGLLMAGSLRAEATLALTNGLFVIFLMLGGILYPLNRMPKIVQQISGALPAAPFAQSLRLAFAGRPALLSADFGLLCLWAVVSIVAAALTFKWE